MNILPRIAAVLIATAMLGVAACGGGGGGGGGDITPPPPPPPPPDGGITRTGVAVAVGPIQDIGSVVVNGITYDTATADVRDDDDNPYIPTRDDDIGKMAVVTGTIEDDNSGAVATTVTIGDAVEGPVTLVEALPPLADGTEVNRLTVLGQFVHVTAATLFDDTPACPADLTQAVAVEVYGTPDADGVIQATFIECRDDSWDRQVEVNGIVSGHEPGAQTFMINALTVDYSSPGAIDNEFPGGQISNGDPVEVKAPVGDFNAANNTLVASIVDYKGNPFGGETELEGAHAEIEGFITEFTTQTRFRVSGIPVLVVDGAEFEGGDASDLGLNVKVEVEGEFDADDVLNATKVEIKSSTAIRVVGVLDATPTDNSLTILGITINTEAARTRFDDNSEAGLGDALTVDDLVEGDYLEVRGQEIPSGQITAMRLERDDPRPDGRTELRGFVTDAPTRPTLMVLGVQVTATSFTTYQDSRGAIEEPMLADEFWAAVGQGVLIDARGTETGERSLEAEELTLESE